MNKRYISAFLVLVMILWLLPAMTYGSDRFADISGHWAEEVIGIWQNYDVVCGKSSTIFDPEGLLTRAEAAQIFTNLLGLQKISDASASNETSVVNETSGASETSAASDIQNNWYADALAECSAAGIHLEDENGELDPMGNISREEFFAVFARALQITGSSCAAEAKDILTKKGYADADEISDYAAPDVLVLVENAYVSGISSENLGPKECINRASVVAMLHKAISAYVGKNSTETAVSAKSEGITLIAKSGDVELSGNGGTVLVTAGARVSFSGQVDTLVIAASAKNTIIEVKSGSEVLRAENKGQNTSIKGNGTVGTIVSAESLTVATKKTNVRSADAEQKITVTDARGKVTETRSAVFNKPSAASAIITKPQGQTVRYDGAAHELITPGAVSTGEMLYALGDENQPTEDYSPEIPTGTSIGTYYIWYKVADSPNRRDAEAKLIIAAIRRMVVVFTSGSTPH